MIRHSFIALILLLSVGTAQTLTSPYQPNPSLHYTNERIPIIPLEAFLARVQDYPTLAAMLASRSIAQAQLTIAKDPFSLDVSGGYARTGLDIAGINTIPNTALPDGLDPDNPVTHTLNASLGLSLRPFAFGDIADLVAQREIEFATADLDYRELLAQLESQAVQSAYQLQLAQQGLVLAEQGVTLAQDILRITETRFNKGSATRAEVRDARLGNFEAEVAHLNALDSVRLAELGLAQLVGDVVWPELPELSPLTIRSDSRAELQGATGADVVTPPSFTRAALRVRQAEIAKAQIERALYPTAQVGYTRNFDDNHSLELSIESRTLQPNVRYTYRGTNPDLSGLSSGDSAVSVTTRDVLSVGVSMTISPGAIANLSVAQEQLEAAKVGVEGAEREMRITAEQLRQELIASKRNLTAQTQTRDNALAALEETRHRVSVGLVPPLSEQQTFVTYQQAQLELFNAELRYLQSVLATYSTYAVSLSITLTP